MGYLAKKVLVFLIFLSLISLSACQLPNAGRKNRPEILAHQPDPKIIYFEAEPPFVLDGSSTKLRWRTDDAISAKILGIGSVTITGNREVTPRKQTTYKLVATNSAGQSISDEITISIAIPRKYEPPNDFKIRAIKQFNKLNPKKALKISPQILRRINLKKLNSISKSAVTKPNLSRTTVPMPKPRKLNLLKRSVLEPKAKRSSTEKRSNQQDRGATDRTPKLVLPRAIQRSTIKQLPAQTME